MDFSEPHQDDARAGLEVEQRREEMLRRLLVHHEARSHRVRAELARLRAKGEDAEADRLEQLLGAGGAPLTDVDLPRQDAPSGQPGRRAADSTRHAASNTQDLAPPATRGSVAAASPAPGPDVPPLAERKIGTGKSRRRKGGKRNRGKRKQPPAWGVSLLAHAAILVVLAVATMTRLPEHQELVLLPSVAASEVVEQEFTEIALDAADELPQVDDSLFEFEELSQLDLPLPPVAELLDAAPSLIEAPLSVAQSTLLDIGPPTGDQAADAVDGAVRSGSRGDRQGRGDARFFGARSGGDRFVFLIDNSGSMVDGRMYTAIAELRASIEAMSPRQSFYVILYADQPYPMFYPQNAEEMVLATRDNKKRLGEWLQTIEICSGVWQSQVESLEMAIKLRPDAIFMLSDGDIRSKHAQEALLEPSNSPFVMHTLGMTVRTEEQALLLSNIAATHGGVYRPVAVSPIAKELARRRPIRYNRTPGGLWGSRISP